MCRNVTNARFGFALERLILSSDVVFLAKEIHIGNFMVAHISGNGCRWNGLCFCDANSFKKYYDL